MAPIINRFKNFFAGGSKQSTVRRPLTHVIKYDVDPFAVWAIVGNLGDGAFGMVHKVQKIDDPGRYAAAKCITIEDGEELDDMVVEIAILSAYPHNNVVGLIDAYFLDNKLSMMLEFCAGGAVDDIMLELGKPLTEPQICYITHYILHALEYLHANMVIHRDLKAGNILLTADGTVKLADFGVSAMMKERHEKRSSFIGTPYWMAPEVMVCETFKDQPYDCVADIWSLGITCIEMGQMDPPNYQVSAMRVVIKIQKSDPPKFDDPRKWSVYLNDFVASCLVKNPAERVAAKNLKTHPFVRDTPDRRPIIALLSEKNADIVQEEVLMEETASVDESSSVRTVDLESSDDLESQKRASPPAAVPKLAQKRVAASPDATPQAEPKTPPRAFKKKFAAPPPPAANASDAGVVQSVDELDGRLISDPAREPPNTQMSTPVRPTASNALRFDWTSPLKVATHQLSPPKHHRNISPGKEAIEILDDLYNDLDNLDDDIQVVHFDQEEAGAANDEEEPLETSRTYVVKSPDSQRPSSSVSPRSSDDRPAPGQSIKDTANSYTLHQLDERHAAPLSRRMSDQPHRRSNGKPADAPDRRSYAGVEHSRRTYEADGNEEAPEISVAGDGMTSRIGQVAKENEPVRLRVNGDEPDFTRSKPVHDRHSAHSETAAPAHSPHSPHNDSAPPTFAGDTARSHQLSHHRRQQLEAEALIAKSVEELRLRHGERPPTTQMPKSRSDHAAYNNKAAEPAPPSTQSLERRPKLPMNQKLNTMMERIERNEPGLLMPSRNSSRNSSLRRREPYYYQEENGDQQAGSLSSATSSPPPPEPPIDYDYGTPKSAAQPQRLGGAGHASDSVSSPHNQPAANAATSPPRRSKHIRDVYAEPISSISAIDNDPHLLAQHHHKQKQQHHHLHKASPSTGGSSASSASSVGCSSPDEKENRPSALPQKTPGITTLIHRQQPNRATVTKKTRSYMVDGVQVTSTTLHVLGAQQDYAMRRKELQELKRLQRQEARDRQLLNERNEQEREAQDRKFTDFRYNVIKAYDAEMDQLCKIHKKKMEELERLQEEEKKQVAKNIKQVHEKEYRDFQLHQRDEMKRLKYETEMLPKNQRKDVLKLRKEHLEQVQAERENSFFAQRRRAAEKIMDNLQAQHQDALARLDRQFLNEKHDLQRSVESTLWEQERQQMKERFALRRQQLKGSFNNQRYLMQQRHQLELEHIQKAHAASEEQLVRSLAAARKHMPKTLRNESKTRVTMFKESLRINYPNESGHQWQERIRVFEEMEKASIRQKLEEYDLKCKRRLDEQRDANEQAKRELEQIQQEKSAMILKSEEQKVAEYEEEYEQLLADWEQQLPHRKRELEDRFQKEVGEQDQFYAQPTLSQQQMPAMNNSGQLHEGSVHSQSGLMTAAAH